MDNNTKLSEELLKIDGIDPNNISKAERDMFKTMLDKERKHLEKLKSWSNGIFIVFLSLALYGIYKFKHIFGILHIPLIAAWPIMIVFSFGMLFLLWPRNFQQITKSTKKIKNLDFLVQGKHKGCLILGKKNGKRYIDWLNFTLIFIAFWLIIILLGYIFFKDMFGYSIFHPTLNSLLHIVIITITVVPVIIIDIYLILKTPLEELTEIKTEDYTYNRRKFTFKIIAFILVTVFVGIYFSGGSFDIASTAFAKALKNTDNMPWVHMISTSKIIKEDSPLASGAGDSEKWINIPSKIQIEIHGKGVQYSDFTNKIHYVYRPKENLVTISAISTTWEKAIKYKSNSDLLSTLLQLPEQFEGNITRKTGQYQNRKVYIYKINAEIDLTESFAFNAEFEVYVDKTTNFIIVVFEKILDLSGEHIGDLEITFSYPETGPKDIFELGVPETAEVIDYFNQP